MKQDDRQNSNPYPSEQTRLISSCGFSLAELFVVCGIISVVAALVLGAVSRTRMAAQSTRCLSNLHGISLAFTQYSIDNDNRFPDPQAAGQSWESMLHPYMPGTLMFACPADTEVFPVVGSSYDWRDNAYALSTLSGRRTLDVTRTDAVLAFETLPGWHGKHMMNAVLLNGSTAVMSEDTCLGDLWQPVVSAPPEKQDR